MPQMIALNSAYRDPTIVPCATEEELLAFANKLRAAGHAEPLESLMPSTPGNSSSCLIANACNFSSAVRPSALASHGIDYRESSDSREFPCWLLSFPRNMGLPRAQAVADAVDLPLRTAMDWDGTDAYYYIILPREIGNAAHAFDDGVAFQELAR